MLYELRTYHAVPGKLGALNDRFERHTLGFFARHDIHAVGFWTTYIGADNQVLIYLLQWPDLATREARWNAFMADSEWLAAKADTERDGPIVARVENSILTPAAYSALR